MVQTDRSAHISDDWFLVANRNNLTIKILKYITLGENESGLLVLDSRVDGERWLTLEVDPAGCLNVVYQDPHCRLECPERWVTDSAGAVLPRCTMLELPHNKVYVSQQLQRGKVEQTVVVTCGNLSELEQDNLSEIEMPIVAEAVADTVAANDETDQDQDQDQALQAAIDEVVLAPDVLEQMLRRLEQDEQVGPEQTSQVGEAESSGSDKASGIPLLQDVADIYQLESTPEVQPESSADENIAETNEPVPPTPSATEPRPNSPAPTMVIEPIVESVYARPGRSNSKRHLLIALGCVIAIVVVSYVVLINQAPVPVSDSPFAGGKPVATEAKPSIAKPPPDQLIEKSVVVEVPLEIESIAISKDVVLVDTFEQVPAANSIASDPGEPDPLAADPVTSDPVTSDPLEVDANIEQARQLIEQGYINWGVPNAVELLAPILSANAQHPGANALLGQAASVLIVQADAAFADGFSNAAIEVVQDVLVFLPTYAPAQQRLAQWTKNSPE